MHPSTYEYLKPTDEQIARMGRVREAARAFGEVLETELPEGSDKDFAIRGHRSNAMWANVAITRLPDGTPRVDVNSIREEPGVGAIRNGERRTSPGTSFR